MATFGRVVQGAMPGMGRLAQAIAQGGNTYGQAYDNELKSRSQMAQAIAAANAQEANARQTNLETDIQQSRPQVIDESVAMSTGSTLPMVNAVREFTRTGQMPMKPPMGPAEEDGTLPSQFPMVDEATRSTIARELSRMLPMYTNLKDTKPDDFASGMGLFQDQDQEAAVARGEMTPLQLAQLRFAAKGSAPFNSDSSGLVLNNLTGKLDESSGRAGAVTGKETYLGQQAKAGAAENYAQAGKANAEAANARLDGGGAAKAPQGYRFMPDGSLQAIPGGPADPKVKGSNTRTGPMSVTLQKELLESDDTVQSAANVVRALEAARAQNDKPYSGYLAKPRAIVMSNVGGSEAADATVDIDNLMTGQGLDSMKSIFGAAPTEGERKILMDMQASVDKTPAQRKAIMDRAIAAAKRRAEYAGNKAKAIRDGSYLEQGVAAPAVEPPPAAPARVSSDAEYNALPSGATFVGPDGKTRRKP